MSPPSSRREYRSSTGRRSPRGLRNFNHRAYVRVSDRYLDDSLAAIREQPSAYVEGLRRGIARFFRPASDEPGVRKNRRELGAWARLYNKVLSPPSVVVLYALALALGVLRIVRSARSGQRVAGETATLAYVLLTALYVAASWIAIDVGQTWRARMTIEPLVLLFLLPVAVRGLAGAGGHRS